MPFNPFSIFLQEVPALPLAKGTLPSHLSIAFELYNKLNSTRVSIGRYDLLEGTRINDVTVNFFIFLLYKTNRFHVAVGLFSNISQKTSKFSKNISDTLPNGSCGTILFLPHFDVICNLLLNKTHGNMESIC